MSNQEKAAEALAGFEKAQRQFQPETILLRFLAKAQAYATLAVAEELRRHVDQQDEIRGKA